MNQPRSKLSFVLEAMQADDWHEALRLAAKFHDLGEHKATITRAAGCISNPRFFKQVVPDMPAAIAAGKVALIQRYAKPPAA